MCQKWLEVLSVGRKWVGGPSGGLEDRPVGWKLPRGPPSGTEVHWSTSHLAGGWPEALLVGRKCTGDLPVGWKLSRGPPDGPEVCWSTSR